ncbi:MAG: hypothetical protein ACXWGX_10500 [Usitatibacter sp.]
MERSCNDVSQAQAIISEVTEAQLCELSELQLTFVGGGIVDGVPH